MSRHINKDNFQLAEGIKLKNKKLIDDTLNQIHLLDNKAKVIIESLLISKSTKEASLRYAKKIKISNQIAYQQTWQVVNDLNKQALLNFPNTIPKRQIAKTSLGKLLGQLIEVVLLSQGQVITVLAIIMSLVGVSLKLNVPLSFLICFSVLYISILVHELGHILIIQTSGESAVIIKTKYKVVINYSDLVNIKTEVLSALIGPFSAFCFCLTLSLVTLFFNKTIQNLFSFSLIIGIGHLLSWLPSQADGKTLLNVLNLNK